MKKTTRTDTEILRFAPDVVFITEPDGRIVFANENALQVLGYTLAELQAMTVFDISPKDWRETYRQKLAQIVNDGKRHLIEIRLITKSRTKLPFELNVVMMPNGQLYGSCRDISERKQATAALTETNKQLTNLLETIPDPIFFKDGEGRWLIINPPAQKLFHLHDIEWHGKTDMELAKLQPAFRGAYESSVKNDLKTWKKGSLLVSEEMIPNQKGELRTLEVLKMPLFEADGRRKGLVIIGRDISEHKLSQQRIHELAFYDPLTKLPNRRLLLDRLRHAIAGSAHSQQYGAVLHLNLDHFKRFETDAGDVLLHKIALRLSASIQEGDTVGCLGGDVFVIIMEDLSKDLKEAAEQARLLTEKIHLAVKQPHIIDGQPVHLTTSTGITMFLGRETTAETLLKRAKAAAEQAKSAGRDTVCFYNHDLQDTLNRRNKLEQELRVAIEDKQFEMHYQVQVDDQHRIIGAEVLVRWLHTERGLLAPAEYIQLCEDTGLIVSLGRWILEEACLQLKLWQKDATLRNLNLAVNVSAKQFHDPDFVAHVQRILSQTGINPAQLEMELTESSVLQNIDETIAKMRELRTAGIRFSLDDFGTGHSSLQYLKRLPLDQIKIDKSFISDLSANANDAVIVKTIISMSGALGLNVIAEGVENRTQLDLLKEYGCHFFQGYLFGRPKPLKDFESSVHNAR